MWRLLSVEKWQRRLRTTKKRRRRCSRGEEGKSHPRKATWSGEGKRRVEFVALVLWTFVGVSCCVQPLLPSFLSGKWRGINLAEPTG